MAKEIKNIKEFMATASGPSVKLIRIKRNKDSIKYKARTSRYLYTLKMDKKDTDKIKNIEAAIKELNIMVKEIA